MTYEPYGPVILATDLTPVQTARLAEAQSDLPGVDMEEQPVRNYPYGKIGAHLFGYVGIIDEDEYTARKRLGYSPNDVAGKDGLENAYDSYLHGRAGGEQVEVNAVGRAGAPAQTARSRPRRHAGHDDRLAAAKDRREEPARASCSSGAKAAASGSPAPSS